MAPQTSLRKLHLESQFPPKCREQIETSIAKQTKHLPRRSSGGQKHHRTGGMHPFIVGTEWVEDFSAVDYGNIKKSPALRQQYLDSMALYAMFCRIADTPQFAYSPSEGVFAYDWNEAFDVTDFVIKLCLYNTDAGTEQLRRMLQHFSQHPFENDAELCLQSAAEHLNMDANELRSSYLQAMERFCKVCKVTEAQVAELTDVLSDIYPTPLIVYYGGVYQAITAQNNYTRQ